MGVALYLNDVVALNDVEQSVTIDLFLTLRWNDPRLADPDRGSSQAICALPLTELWSPVLQSRGLRQVEKLYQEITAIDARGTVTHAQRANAEISVPLDLRNFPFDRHMLALEVETVFSSVDEVRFVAVEAMSGVADRISITGWSLGTPTTSVEIQHAPNLQIDRPVFRLAVEVRREAQFYVWKVFSSSEGLPEHAIHDCEDRRRGADLRR